jgi:hypothetical protein
MRGDHLTVSRRYFTHHGIDLGDGRVVHYDGEPGNTTNAEVVISSRAVFAAGGKIWVRRYPRGTALSPDETIRRALSRVGERGYHLLISNCEHFASWCKTGEARSTQIENPERSVNRAFNAMTRDVAKQVEPIMELLCRTKKPRNSSRRSS